MGANELPTRFELVIFGLQDRRLTAWPRKLQLYYSYFFKSFLNKKREAREGTFYWIFCFIIFIGFFVLSFLLGFVIYHFYWVL